MHSTSLKALADEELRTARAASSLRSSPTSCGSEVGAHVVILEARLALAAPEDAVVLLTAVEPVP